MFTPVKAPAMAKPVEDPFKKVLIWINVVCFSVVLLGLLWMLST